MGREEAGTWPCSEASSLLSYDSPRALLGPPTTTTRQEPAKVRAKRGPWSLDILLATSFSVSQLGKLSQRGRCDLSKPREQQGLCLGVGKA